jgi:RNA polymerase sigma-70 factor (ECF subfamily)
MIAATSMANRRRFETTQWSLVLATRDRASAEAQLALATLCETYWLPVYAYIRRTGRPVEDARDLTQAFFARVVEKGVFEQAEPSRGRFRAFLLAAVRNFLSNAYASQQAARRGGRHVHLPLEFEHGERQYQLEVPDAVTPESLFETRWARTVVDRAIHRVATRYTQAGRGRIFVQLQPFLSGDSPPYAGTAATLGVTEGALRVTVHRLRQQLEGHLRDVVAETVDSPEEVDKELRYLLSVLSR